MPLKEKKLGESGKRQTHLWRFFLDTHKKVDKDNIHSHRRIHGNFDKIKIYAGADELTVLETSLSVLYT